MRSGAGLRVNPLPRVVPQAAEAEHVEAVFLQQSRGTRGSATAVSGGEDGAVPRKLIEAGLELIDRYVGVALDSAELFDLRGLSDVQ
jgi:hypothetical protein